MFKPMCVCVCGPTCEVFLSELDQWENHAVSHLVGELRVQRVQLDHTKQIIQKYQAPHKNTARKRATAKHLEGFQFILLRTETFAASYSCSKRNQCRQCPCFMKRIVKPAVYSDIGNRATYCTNKPILL